MAYESTMAMVAVGADGKAATLTTDENGALRFSGAPAVEPGDASPGPRPSGVAILYLARAPNGNPSLLQLDETGAIMTAGLGGGTAPPAGGDGGLTEEQADGLYLRLEGGQLTGPLMFADKSDFLMGFDGVSRYLQWGNGYSDSIEEATGKRYWVGPEGPRMSLDADGTLGVSGRILAEQAITLEGGDPVEDLDAASKGYVDSRIATLQATITDLTARLEALEAART